MIPTKQFSYSIQILSINDLDALYRIECDNFSHPWTKEQLKKALESNNFLFLGIFESLNDKTSTKQVEDNQILQNTQDNQNKKNLAAYLTVQCLPSRQKLKDGECEIINIATSKAHRRNGLAEELLNFLLLFVKQNKADSILLDVRETNIPALCLYKKIGFVEVGRRKNYYTQVFENKEYQEDAIIMKYQNHTEG